MKRTSAWEKWRLGRWIHSPRWRTTSDSACLCACLRAGPFPADERSTFLLQGVVRIPGQRFPVLEGRGPLHTRGHHASGAMCS